MIKTPWRLAGRLLARDWRSGEVLVLLAALVVAVAAMSAVTFFTDRVRSAVSQQAGEALAADLRVESINPLPPAMHEAAVRHGLATADIVSFRSVVAAGDYDVAGRRARRDAPAIRCAAWCRSPIDLAGMPAERHRHSGARRSLGRAEPHGAARSGRRRRARGRPAAAAASRGRSSFGPTRDGASWRSRPPCSSTTTTCSRRGCWRRAASPSTRPLRR